MLLNIFEFSSIVLLAYNIIRIKADANEDALLSTLFNNYNSKSRPSPVHTRPTTVSTSLILNQIIDVRWYDLRLAWNTSNYSGLGIVTVPAENVWRPDIILFNGAEKFDFQSDYQYVRIMSSGEIAWVPNGEIKTQCTLDVKYFPYDEQNCSISISSASFFVDQIDFVVSADVILDYYLPNTEWTLKNNSNSKNIITKPFPVAIVSFYLIIERKPLFFVFNMILPCVIILVVAFLSFLVPIQSGEKMSIGITTLLSISVLLLVISDHLPPTSDSIPLISVFYAVSTGIIAMICLMSVLTLNIHHYGELGKPVPMILQKIFFTIFAKIILFPRVLDLDAIRSKYSRNHENVDDKRQNLKSIEANDENLNRNCHNCCAKLFRKKKVTPINYVENNDTVLEKDVIELQWTLLADIIDRFVFYVLLFSTTFILLGILNQAPTAYIF